MPDAAGREAFLAANQFCVLGTQRQDGRARLSPMMYVYDNGTILISTTRARGGGKTAKRDPRVTVCVFNPANTREYLTVYGRAAIDETEAASIALFGTFAGATLAGDALAAARKRIADEGRIVLRITPEAYFPR